MTNNQEGNPTRESSQQNDNNPLVQILTTMQTILHQQGQVLQHLVMQRPQ